MRRFGLSAGAGKWPRLFMTIGCAAMLVACDSPRRLPRATDDLITPGTPSRELAGVQIISESDFTALLERGGSRPPAADRLGAAIDLAAAANSDGAVGIAGKVRYGARVQGDVFLVARDPVLTQRGQVQSKDFYVAAAKLSGRVAWTATQPLLLLGGEDNPKHAARLQGCMPLAGSGGLPADVILNLEAGAPANLSETPFELHVLGATDQPTRDRFVCAGLARIAQTATKPLEAAELPVFAKSLEFPPDAVVISEADFNRILRGKKEIRIAEDAKAAAARFATAAGDPSALGIQAQFVPGKDTEFSTSFVIVVRDPILNATILGAKEFYFVPIDFAGTATWLGRNVRLGFRGESPNFNLDASFCGPRFTLRREPDCGLGLCIGGSHPWMGSGFGVGGPEPGGFKPTVRLFGLREGLLDFSAIACTQFLEPPERDSFQCGTLTGGRGPEICNGRDDDCNGVVDDPPVCDTVPRRCPAQPRTCGAVTCGTLPDGCGGVLKCGGPCP